MDTGLLDFGGGIWAEMPTGIQKTALKCILHEQNVSLLLQVGFTISFRFNTAREIEILRITKITCRTIATLRMTHRLKVLYSSGAVREDMKFSARTAFYPIGWAMHEVWGRICRDLRDSTISDANYVEYYRLFARAKLLLPDEVWALYFANNNHSIDPVLYTSGGRQTPSPLQTSATNQLVDAIVNFGEAPGPPNIGNTDTTPGSHSARLLISLDIPAGGMVTSHN